jgi:hypothetical protein
MIADRIDADRYYRGVMGERIRGLSDNLLETSQEAEREGAHEAAMFLADAATQLLDVGLDTASRARPIT